MTIDRTLIAKITRSGIAKFAVTAVFAFVFLASPLLTYAATPKQLDINIMVDSGGPSSDYTKYKVVAINGGSTLELKYQSKVDKYFHYRYYATSTLPNTGWIFRVSVPTSATATWQRELSTGDSAMVVPLRYNVNNSGFTYVDVGGTPRADPDPTHTIFGTLVRKTTSAGVVNYQIKASSGNLLLGTKFANTTWTDTAAKVGNAYECTYKGTLTAPRNRTCKDVAPVVGPAGVSFRLFPTANSCSETEALTCWIAAVFGWSQTGILILATVAFVVAGIIYMTSAGNTKQIELAKKIMFGALSGVATIVLGKFFLTVVVGVPWV